MKTYVLRSDAFEDAYQLAVDTGKITIVFRLGDKYQVALSSYAKEIPADLDIIAEFYRGDIE